MLKDALELARQSGIKLKIDNKYQKFTIETAYKTVRALEKKYGNKLLAGIEIK